MRCSTKTSFSSSSLSVSSPPSTLLSSASRSTTWAPLTQSSSTTLSVSGPSSTPRPSSPSQQPSPLPDIRLEVGRLLHIFPVYPPRQCYQLKLFHLLLMQPTPGTLTPSPFAPDITLPALFTPDHANSPSPHHVHTDSAYPEDIVSALQTECAKIFVLTNKPGTRARKASIGTAQRQVAISPVCSDGYGGGVALREMLWNHAQYFIPPMLRKLKPGIGQHGAEERVIVGIVTRRVFARVVVTVTEEEEGGNIWLGGVDESAGVVGMHMVVFGCEVRERSAKLWKLPRVGGMNIPEVRDGQGNGCRVGEWLGGMEGAWGEWKTVQMGTGVDSTIRH